MNNMNSSAGTLAGHFTMPVQPMPTQSRTFGEPGLDNGHTTNNLVFISPDVSDIDHLIKGIQNAAVVVLDPARDGIAQVSSVLQHHQDLDSVHFITHGVEGGIRLGQTLLDSTTLSTHAELVESWGQAIAEGGDFLFYGCNVASGDRGMAFVEHLHIITSADIAASTNVTGAEQLDGDWEFEATFGTIDTRLIFAPEVMAEYESTFALPTVLFVVGNTNLNSSDQAIQSRFQSLGYDVVVRGDRDSSSNDAVGQDLVFISESVASGRVNTKFSSVAVPVIAAESYVFDDMGMTSTVTDIDYGKEINTTLVIVDETNPLAAGLSGTVTAFTSPSDVSWGNPNASADTVATLPNGGDRAAIFTYDQASLLIDGTAAPSRRVGFFIGSNANELTNEGWQLFDAAVNWATGDILPPSDGAQFSLSQDRFTVDEDAGAATITVNRTGDTTRAASVTLLTTTDGSATAGDDYAATTETLNFAATETTKIVSVPIIDDGIDEGDETVGLALSNPVGGELGRAIATLTITDNDTDTPTGGRILFVANRLNLGTSDQAIRNQFESLGYQVTVQDDNVVTLSDTVNQDLVFISESSVSQRVNTKLTDATIPIISAEAYLFDDLGLTGTITGVDYDTQANQTALNILTPTSPLAGGLSGQVTVYGTPGELAWGRPKANAELIAALPGSPDQATIFTYDETDILVSGASAPAKRVGFFIASDATQLTPDGWTLLESAVRWAIDAITPPPPPTDTLPPTATLSASDITTGGGTTYSFTVTYADGTAVDVDSLGSTDIRVTGPNGFNQLANLVNVSPNTDGSPLTATYQIPAPGGDWNSSDNGTFSVTLVGGEVSDIRNNTIEQTQLGQFNVNVSVTASGILSLGETELSVSEGAGFVTVEFLRSDGSDGTATLQYSTVDLTATPDVDYPDTVETLTFAPGETRKTVNIPIIDDGEIESDEQFGIGLTSATGAILGAPRTAVITIVDNDSAPPPPPAALNVLFVAGNSILTASDQAIRNQFEQLGHTVTVRDDDLITNADALGRDLIYISESIASSKVTNTFAQTAIPVIASEAFVFDDMGLTGRVRDGDYGTTTGQTTVSINPSAPSALTSGLSGNVAVFNTASEIAWGVPDNTAFSVGTLLNNPDQSTIFAYDNGATLANGAVANARRVGFFLGSNAQAVTPDGWALFAASIEWATATISETLSLTLSDLTVNEGDGTASLTVRRSGSGSGVVQVDYATADGSARAGDDYTAVSGTLSFQDGETLATITVPILDDTFDENSETVVLTLINPVGIDLGTARTATITILDNDTSSGTFTRETVFSGLTLPTAFDWTPDGDTMYIAEKSGLVKVYQNGILLSTPFINLQERVNDAGDRGLGGIAVHPDFATNPYVYLAYTYDPPEVQGRTDLSGPDGRGNRPSQVIRVTADPSTNFTTVLPGSEVILLGKNSTWANTTEGNSTGALGLPPSGIDENGNNIQDYLTTDSTSHSVGGLQFGIDGSLFVSNGDGASFNFADPRGVRVQDIDNLSGKILRIDPITGEGLSDNPFFNGDPDSNRSKVYSYGLRNPFRFTIHPETNEPFIGDVGWTQWEEVNTGRGANFGWPYYEGGTGINLQTTEYEDLPEAQAFYASGEQVEAPIFALDHVGDDRMRAIIMGDFYDGGSFPALYEGALFFTGFERGNVYYMTFEADGDVDSVNLFDSGVPGIAQITTGQDSNLYYLNLFEGTVGRWRFQG